jgi:hypothetical protein
MAEYAVISGNTVVNVIVADTKAIAEEVTGLTCVQYEKEKLVTIGWTYDGAEFTAPVIETSKE